MIAKKQSKTDTAIFDAGDEQLDHELNAAPTPARPAESIFQSIFNVESDMEISGDKDEQQLPDEPDISDSNGIFQHANEVVNEFDIHGRARRKRQMMARDGRESESKSTENAAMPLELRVHNSNNSVPAVVQQTKARDGRESNESKLTEYAEMPLESQVDSRDKSVPAVAQQPPDSDDSSSSHAARRRKHKHRHRRHDTDSDSDESSRRRRKHKHRHKEKKRRKDKRR